MRVGVSDAHGRRSRWLSLISGACILGWAVPALLMLNKGFGVQDEGSYVLSYRFWRTNPYFVSGAQYLYGPAFEAVGESIPWLRLLRLVMVLGANAWFAACFVSWLEQQKRGSLPASRTGLLLLITASGGMSYLWTPLTPGYYDLTADCCLALTALLLLSLAQSPRPRAWVPWAMGVVGVALLVTKWTAFPAFAVTVGVALWCVIRVSGRSGVRFAVHVLLGTVLALVACQLFLIPLGRFVAIMWKVSSLTTVASHSFLYLATANLTSTAALLLAAGVIGIPLVIGLFAARSAAGRGADIRARRWLIAAAVLTTFVLPLIAGWRGGDDRGRALVGVALSGLLVAVSAAVRSGSGPMPGGPPGVLLAIVLFLVPFFQAAGTNVPLLYVAAECVAMWVALVLMLVTRAEVPSLTTDAVLIDLAVLVVATAMIAGTTTLMTPFKTTSIQADTVRVPELGVRVASVTAHQDDALRTALAPYVDRGRTPMITLDQMAGLTYLLGGVPAGSTWTDAVSPSRSAGILELACRNGDVPTRDPVLLLDRPLDPLTVRAMETCGFGDPKQYRELDVPDGPSGIRVLVPRA